MKTTAWEEINKNIYNLCLQHCPPVLESVIKANSIWENILCDQNEIVLLLVLRDIKHEQDKKIKSTMSYVEAFLIFSTTFQSEKQKNTSYYELFKYRRDTVKYHGGQPGYHERLY